jgi:8-oxo-dGTP diphosphatase
MTTAPLHPVDLFLALTDADRILLARRHNTGYADGQWNLPSGKLELGEDVLAGVIREAREEVGLRLRPDRLRLASVVHHLAGPGHARVGLVFAADFAPREHGEPVNAEPHKCDAVEWFPIDALPADTTAYTIACVRGLIDGEPLRLDGWPIGSAAWPAG